MGLAQLQRHSIGHVGLLVDLRLPHGTVFNPEDTRPLAQANIWATAIETFCVWLGTLSQAYYMRGFWEEMFGFRSAYGIAMAGYDQYGKRRALLAAHTGTIGAGASAIRDGLDPGGERRPLVHEIGHPARPNYEQAITANIWHPHHIPEPFALRNGDITIDAHGAPGGFGDPIERDPAAVKRDLDSGLTTPDIAERIYCVEASYDTATQSWAVDAPATARRRAAKRAERLRRAVPVQQWWRAARQRFTAHTLPPLISEMYASSMRLSEPFAREFRAFWGLPNNWNPEVH
ncbi:MAG: 5-oxoprolinase [Deltaproteobacteria bacterium]|nr:5-oxoprolinase [Deltaproteobacteria bacterium]